MELRHLRHFIGVAEELNFSKAAVRLHIEQSPLSRSIKDLENDLGVQLFERTTRSTKLTEAGTAFLQEARQILLAVDKARLRIKNQNNKHHHTVRVALIENFVPSYATKRFAQYRKTNSTIQLNISEIPEDQLTNALQDGRVDAVISPRKVTREGFTSIPLWSDELAIITPKEHPLSTSNNINIRDLTTYPLVTLKPLSYHLINKHLNATENEQTTLYGLQASNIEMMILLLSTNSRIGLATYAQIPTCYHPEIAIRLLIPNEHKTTSYLISLDPPSEKFIALLKCLKPALDS
ncbi:LysR family transcriptional regulator [Pseudomonas sp. REP124]|uniref:LysR family transcriptional regulator n=1 Tax=Pseudomonas sp. REP124 TaxID=2875731 RepID=UPI001CC9B361|nr:LysR family transcriptional regulator [Pseudomonas sp. REP124]MBZ9784267.1 LysR family transcriptional regulator [Pseudomonas sp. REP124]